MAPSTPNVAVIVKSTGTELAIGPCVKLCTGPKGVTKPAPEVLLKLAVTIAEIGSTTVVVKVIMPTWADGK
jgi:hypothetical protein